MVLSTEDDRELEGDGVKDLLRAAGNLCVSIAAGGLLSRCLVAFAAAAFCLSSSFLSLFDVSFLSLSSLLCSFFCLLPPKSDQLGDLQIAEAADLSSCSAKSMCGLDCSALDLSEEIRLESVGAVCDRGTREGSVGVVRWVNEVLGVCRSFGPSEEGGTIGDDGLEVLFESRRSWFVSAQRW